MEHQSPEFLAFVQWGFYSLLTGCLIVGVKALTDLKDSIAKLNETMVKIVEQISWHEKEIDRMDKRLLKLERE